MKSILQTISLLLFLVIIWKMLIWWFALPDYLLPTPSQTLHALTAQYTLLIKHSGYTFLEIFLGLLLGVILGCCFGFITAFFKPLQHWFFPLLILSQALPTFAIAPLLVLWLGYGLSSKIAVTTLMIFFPIASSLYDGLKKTEQGWLDLAKTMNAKPLRIFLFIRLPAALPALASGIRIAAVSAPIGAIVGEWVGSSRGLGYLILNANARLQTDTMFAALLIIMLTSLFLYFLVDLFLRWAIKW